MADPTMPEGVVSAASDADGVTIVRIFDAPRELVFEAWTRRDRFAAWFGEPDPEHEVDPQPPALRVGDTWTALAPGQQETWASLFGEVLELVEPELVTMTFADRQTPNLAETVRIELRDLGEGRTEMTMSLRGPRSADAHAKALAGALNAYDRLAEHLAKELKARHDSDEPRAD